MTHPEWYQIPAAASGVNLRPTGPQPDLGLPPFADLFGEALPQIVAGLRDVFDTCWEHIAAGVETAITWVQNVLGVNLDWCFQLVCNLFGYWERPDEYDTWGRYLVYLIFEDEDSIFRLVIEVPAKLICFGLGFIDLPEDFAGWSGYLFHLILGDPLGTLLGIGQHWIEGLWGMVNAPALFLCGLMGYTELPENPGFWGGDSWWGLLIHLLLTDPLECLYQVRVHWSQVGRTFFDRPSEIICKFFDRTDKGEYATWTEYLVSLVWPEVDSFGKGIKHFVYALLDGPCGIICNIFGYWTRPPSKPNTSPAQAWETNTWTEYLLWLILDDPTSVFHLIVEFPCKIICFLLGFIDLGDHTSWASLLWHLLTEDPAGTLLAWLDHWVGGAWDILNGPAQFIANLAGKHSLDSGVHNWWHQLAILLSADAVGTINHIRENWSDVGYIAFDRIAEIVCRFFDLTDKGSFDTWTEYLLDGFWPQVDKLGAGLKATLFSLFDGPAKLLCNVFGHATKPGNYATWTEYAIHLIFDDATANFTSITAGMLDGLTDAIHSVVDGVEDNLSNGIANMLFVFFPQLKTQVPPGKTAEWWASQSDWDKASYVLSHVGDFVFSVGQSFVDGLTGALSDIGEGIDTAANSFATFLLGLLSVPAGYEPDLPAYERLGKFLISHLFDWITWPVCAILGIPVDTAHGQSATEALLARMFGAGSVGGVPGPAAAVSGFGGVFGLGLIPTLPQLKISDTGGWLSTGISDANTAAGNALSAANTANTAAGNALSAANTANTAAGNALSAANTANTAAGNALSAANTAQQSADNALSAANTANTAASNAHAEAVNAQNATAELHANVVQAYGGLPQQQPENQPVNYSDLLNAGKTLQYIARAGQAMGTTNTAALADVNIRPLWMGGGTNSVVSFPLPIIGDAPPFILASWSLPSYTTGFAFLDRDQPFNALKWVGRATEDINYFRLIVGRLSTDGGLELLHWSDNLAVSDENDTVALDPASKWNRNLYKLPDVIYGRKGEVYAFGVMARRNASGSAAAYEIVAASTWAAADETTLPKTPGAVVSTGNYAPGVMFSYPIAAIGMAVDEQDDPIVLGVDTILRQNAANDSIYFSQAGTIRRYRHPYPGNPIGGPGASPPAVIHSDVDTVIGLGVAATDDVIALRDNASRTVQVITPTGAITAVDVVGEDAENHPEQPQPGFAVSGVAALPDGAVAVYDNDQQSLLVVNLSLHTVTAYPFDPGIDSVTVMYMAPRGSVLFLWNESTRQLISMSTRDFSVTSSPVIDLPTGYVVKDIADDDSDDNRVCLSVYSPLLDACILVIAEPSTGNIWWGNTASADDPPDDAAKTPVTGAAAMCRSRFNPYFDGIEVAVVDDGVLTARTGIYIGGITAEDITYEAPLPWFALTTVDAELIPPRFDPATPHLDQLVSLSAIRTVIPDWVNTIFMVPIGAGGGGGGTIYNNNDYNGYGGHPGGIFVQAAYRGVHFMPGDEIWADIGKGGLGGPGGTSGFPEGISGTAGEATRIHLGGTLNAAVAYGGAGGEGGNIRQGSHPLITSWTQANKPTVDVFKTQYGMYPGDPDDWIFLKTPPDKWYPRRTDLATGDQIPSITVAGQTILTGGVVLDSAGASPGGGGAGGRRIGGGYMGYAGANGAAYAILSNRLV